MSKKSAFVRCAYIVMNALRLRGFRIKINRNAGEKKKMSKEVVIGGMTCSHCKSRVEKALLAVNGVDEANVNLESQIAYVDLSRDVSDEDIKNAIQDAGYEFISMR